jgi:broad specificity phosphatase PhoE
MKRRVILIRHGETEANRLRRFAGSGDIPLSDVGRRQAAELASRLVREFHSDLLLSSHYLRARQTSEIIGRAINLESGILAGIHERNFGCLEGHPYERMGEVMLSDAAYDPRQPWTWRPEGGESLEQVRDRAFAALDTLRNRPAREILIVCHGAVIQSICAAVTGQWLDSYLPVNCGFVVAEFSDTGWKLGSAQP